MENKIKNFEDYVKRVFEKDLCDIFNLDVSKINEITGNINAKRKNIITEAEKLAHEQRISKEDNRYCHDRLRKYKKLPGIIQKSFDLSYHGDGYFSNIVLLDQTSLNVSLKLVNNDCIQFVGGKQQFLNYLIVNSKELFSLIISVVNHGLCTKYSSYSSYSSHHGQLIDMLICTGILPDFTKYYNQPHDFDAWISKFNILLEYLLNKDSNFYLVLENYISSITIKYMYKWYCRNKNYITDLPAKKENISIFLEYIKKFLSNYGYKF